MIDTDKCHKEYLQGYHLYHKGCPYWKEVKEDKKDKKFKPDCSCIDCRFGGTEEECEGTIDE